MLMRPWHVTHQYALHTKGLAECQLRQHVGVSGETRRRFQWNASRLRHLRQNLLNLQLDKLHHSFGVPVARKERRTHNAEPASLTPHALASDLIRASGDPGTGPEPAQHKLCDGNNHDGCSPVRTGEGVRAPGRGSPPGVAQTQNNNFISTPGCYDLIHP